MSWARGHYSPGELLFATVVLLGILLLVTSLVASQYYQKDVVTSLTFFANDGNCRTDLREGLGVHCFGDYAFLLPYSSHPNPWLEQSGLHINYLAAGLLPHWFFGGVGTTAGNASVGLVGYLLLLTGALVTPAVWASRGKSFSTRLVTFGVFGLISLPSLMALDRGNSVALAVPPLLAFLVALRRGQDRMAIISIVLATLVKPQYGLLVLAFLAARKWRQTLWVLTGIVVTNVLAFLVWPRDFPGEMGEAGRNLLGYATSTPMSDKYPANVSLSKGLYLIESAAKWLVHSPPGTSWVDAHANMLGPIVVIIISLAIFMMGTRLPPYLGAVLIMMCASLFPSVSWSYYLVFTLPVAAILLRDPLGAPPRDRWRGVFDDESLPVAKIIASALVVLATAMSVSRVLLPTTVFAPGLSHNDLLGTSAELAPVLWIAAALAVVVAWWVPASQGIQPLGKRPLAPREAKRATA